MSGKLKLKKPDMEAAPASPASQPSPARFIADGDRRPEKGKGQLCSFRLPPAFVAFLEEEAMRSGQTKTMILKAALAGFSEADTNEKNKWYIEAVKFV